MARSHRLDDRFHPREILPASELQNKGFGEIEKLLARHQKVLITHHGRPAAVTISWAAFEELLHRLEVLEDAPEEEEIARLIRSRPAGDHEEWPDAADFDATLNKGAPPAKTPDERTPR